MKQRLDSLTSSRFLAALFVAIHHTLANWAHTPAVDAVGRVGWLGVPYFFILSGFVLMWSFDNGTSKALFIWKRLARIYPLHIVCLITSLMTFVTFGTPFGGYIGTVRGTLANFLLIHDWLPHHPEVRQAWNGVSWTLSCELFFYLIAPWLFSRMLRESSVKRLLAAIAACYLYLLAFALLAARAHSSRTSDLLFYWPPPHLLEFSLGALGAMLIRRGWRFQSIPLSIASMIIPIIYCTLTPGLAKADAVMLLLFIPGAFLLIISLACREIGQGASILTKKRLVFLGEASYALYMTHAIFLGMFTYALVHVFSISYLSPFWGELTTAIYLCLAVGISALAHRHFEVPAKIWLLKLHLRRSPTLRETRVST
ncbi:MAG TPA: acyltransferase [Steroidobacteraceae bacterium]|nr:acyltransferase [Steroidobacteraceae bacterium]